MKLIKHFDFENQNELDLKYWTIATGSKWANKELQIYTDNKNNLFFENGLLIQATYENNKYYSARLHTKNKFSIKYGRIEIIFKVPKGKGTWPAIWMMPVNNEYGVWPKSGEIDIIEHSGNRLDKPFFCLHTEKYNHTGKEKYKLEKHIPGFSDDFNKITLDWGKDKITYFLNDEHLVTYRKGMDGLDNSYKGWPFDKEFYLLINLAIGGTFGGTVDDNCFPQKYIIKDIKIFSEGVKNHG
jgi:beta-glucanase (GH16 family)